MSGKALIALFGAFALGCLLGYNTAPRAVAPGRVTVLTRIDTVAVPQPAEVSRRRVAEVPAALPVAADTADTVVVRVPIESAVYESADYRAYVSGYRAALDSITVFRRVSFVAAAHEPKRWSVGLQAGYGITPRGFQPYIGLGVEFRFVSF